MTFFIRHWSALGALAVLAVSATMPAFAAAPVTTASGLIYESLKDGTGPSPKASDTVRVHYRGTFPESGKEFDSSIARGQPIEFPLTGARGAGGVIPPNATLNFEVELLGIK